MRFSAKTLWGMGLTVSLWGNVAVAAEGVRTQVTVLVIDSAGILPSVLRQGEAEAARVFSDAGIEIDWTNCGKASDVQHVCPPVASSKQFVLHIVSDGKTSTDSVFGEAFLGEDGSGKYCDIFYARIQSAPRDAGANVAEILGAVAAHEIGHLLLGSRAHSRIGIMEPVWEKESLRQIGMGTLLFTPDQAVRMKARTGERCSRPAQLGAGVAVRDSYF